ncbi:MAG: hypothetical protein QXI91_05335 [Candidatus Bathyarchaeia archaeon]
MVYSVEYHSFSLQRQDWRNIRGMLVNFAMNTPILNRTPASQTSHATVLNITLYGVAPDSSRYTSCTALLYFGFKPSTATATLTVEPQSTQLLITDKTPEQIQQEAEQSGWLTIWHEWSWLYPWYRMHYNFTMNGAKIDVGFNPILPRSETAEYSGLEGAFPQITVEEGLTPEEIYQIIEAAVIEAAVGVLVASVTAIAAANTRIPFATVVALGIYAGVLTGMIAYAGWLYSSGAKAKAKAFLVGLIVDLWAVALSAFMSVKAAFMTEMVASVVGVIFSSLFDPSNLKVILMAATAALYASVFVGIAMLILVPEPNSISFKLLFPAITLLFSAIALNILCIWR